MAADANWIESLYASVGRSPFNVAVTRDNSVPCATTAAVEPSTSSAIPSMHWRPRIAACASDSLLGGTKSKSAQDLRSRALYSGWGIPASSADHSFRRGRFMIERPNASATRSALSTLRRRGLAKMAVGRSTGQACERARICASPHVERGARSKLEVYAGRTISPCRMSTRLPVIPQSLQRRPRVREYDRHRPIVHRLRSGRLLVRGCVHRERAGALGGDRSRSPSHRASLLVPGVRAGSPRRFASDRPKADSVISVLV